MQFVQELVAVLDGYGMLEGGQYALEALLLAAKNYVGQDKRDYCDALIQEIRNSQGLKNDELANRSGVSSSNFETPFPDFVPVPPLSKGFKGRIDELQLLTSCLLNKTISIVIIEGISGVGKTCLAAHFASKILEYDYKAFWIDCREDTSIDTIFWNLANFAYHNGNNELANVLEKVDISQEERLTNNAAVLAKFRYALFFDDYQFISNPHINHFIKKIEQRSGFTKVFLCSRIRSDITTYVHPISTKEIRLQSGLDSNSCAQFLAECGIDISTETVQEIWTLTGGGHPKALEIFATRAKSYPVSQLLTSLPIFRDELKQEWLSPLLDELPPNLRDIVIDLSIFDRPISFQGIRKLYPSVDIDPAIISLIDRFILDQVDGNFLLMHQLIREYYYSLIDDPTVKHSWAANYYMEEMGLIVDTALMSEQQIDFCLIAWSHFMKAGEHAKAVEVVGKLRTTLINRGCYEQFMILLERTTPANKEDELWFAINEARIFSLWGEVDLAIKRIKPITKSEIERLAKEAILVLALIYCEHNFPEKAIDLLEESKHYFLGARNRLTIQRFISRNEALEHFLTMVDRKNINACRKQLKEIQAKVSVGGI